MIGWILSVIIPGTLFCQNIGYLTYLRLRREFPALMYLHLPYEERRYYTAYGKTKKPIVSTREYLGFLFGGNSLIECLVFSVVQVVVYWAITFIVEFLIQLFDTSYHVNSETRDIAAYMLFPFLYFFTNIIVIYIHLHTIKDALEIKNKSDVGSVMFRVEKKSN